MPKRTRSHEIEEASRVRLRETFNNCGWVVWDLHPDYGEDLLVRVFIDGVATHYSFFVQAKATDHIEKYMSKDGEYIHFPIDVEHLKYWGQFWEPVVLTLWDANSDVTYWEIIQDYLRLNDVTPSRKRLRISIPTTNILDTSGLENILSRTKLRFQRFELMGESVSALIGWLQGHLNIEVSYEPGDESGAIHYLEDSDEHKTDDIDVFFLGDAAKEVAEALHLAQHLQDFHIGIGFRKRSSRKTDVSSNQ